MIQPALRDFHARFGSAAREKASGFESARDFFAFVPALEEFRSHVEGGIPFGLLGQSRAEMDSLVDDASGVVFGTYDHAEDPCLADDVGTDDVNRRFTCLLCVGFTGDVICSARYELRGWTLSDDAQRLAMAKDLLIDGKPRVGHVNIHFPALTEVALAAAGLKSKVGKKGKKERQGDGCALRVSWTQRDAESLFAKQELIVEATLISGV